MITSSQKGSRETIFHSAPKIATVCPLDSLLALNSLNTGAIIEFLFSLFGLLKSRAVCSAANEMLGSSLCLASQK